MLRRNSDRLVAIQAIRMARSAAVVLLPTLLLLRVATGPGHTVLLVFVVYYSYTRVYGTFAERLVVAYSCSAAGFLLRRGRISRTSSHVEWRNVRAITLNASLLHRLLGCTQVTITPSGAHEVSFVLQAVRTREAARIQRIARLHATAAAVEEPGKGVAGDEARGHEPARRDVVLTPVLRMRDHLLIGVTYGRFVLVVPLVLSTVHAVAQLGGLDLSSLAILRLVAALRPPEVGGVVSGVLLLGLVYGTVLSWLRYRSLEVVRRGDDLVFRGGFLDHETRIVATHHVGIVVVRQNLLMRWTGTGQFRCIVGGTDGRVSQSMLLPVAPLGRGMRILAESFPDLDASRASRGAGVPRRFLVLSILTAIALVMAVVAAATLGAWPPAVVTAAVAAALVVGILRVNSAGGRASVDEEDPVTLVVARTGLLWGRTVICRIGAIESLTLRAGGVRGLTGSIRTTVRFCDRFTRLVVIRTAAEHLPRVVLAAMQRHG